MGHQSFFRPLKLILRLVQRWRGRLRTEYQVRGSFSRESEKEGREKTKWSNFKWSSLPSLTEYPDQRETETGQDRRHQLKPVLPLNPKETYEESQWDGGVDEGRRFLEQVGGKDCGRDFPIVKTIYRRRTCRNMEDQTEDRRSEKVIK